MEDVCFSPCKCVSPRPVNGYRKHDLREDLKGKAASVERIGPRPRGSGNRKRPCHSGGELTDPCRQFTIECQTIRWCVGRGDANGPHFEVGSISQACWLANDDSGHEDLHKKKTRNSVCLATTHRQAAESHYCRYGSASRFLRATYCAISAEDVARLGARS